MGGSLLLLTVVTILTCSASPSNLEQSCVRMVQRSGVKSFTVTETTCDISPNQECLPCICKNVKKKQKYVTHYFIYYSMEAQCCDGYREIRKGDKVKCEAYPKVFFQLLFSDGENDCSQWKSVFDSHKVAKRFSEGLSKILSSICSCDMPSSNIVNVHLVCIGELPGAKVFQGGVITTDNRNSTQVVDDIQTVAAEEKSMLLLGKNLTALDNCICCNIITKSDLGSESEAKKCASAPKKSTYKLKTGEGMGIGISIFFLVIFILAVLTVVWCWKRRRPPQHQQLGAQGGPRC